MHRIPELLEQNDLVGAAIVSPEGRFLRVNDLFCKLLGYDRDRLLTLTFQEISHPDDIKPPANKYLELISSKGNIDTLTLNKRYRHGKTGDWVHCKLFAQGFFDENDEFLYFFSRIAPTNELSTSERIKLDRVTHAIANDEFIIHYQPIVCLDSREVKGYEALSRWQDKDQLRMPGDFIPLLRKGKCEHHLCYWVLDQIIKQQPRFNQAGHWLSFNVSPMTIARADWSDHPLPPDSHMEILENADVSPLIQSKIKEVRKRGIKIALDDFGGGFASIHRLINHEIDLVKFDNESIVSKLPDKNAVTVIQAIVALAKQLGIETIAEGVERVEQAEILLDSGCDMGQGFLFGKAMAISELESRSQVIN